MYIPDVFHSASNYISALAVNISPLISLYSLRGQSVMNIGSHKYSHIASAVRRGAAWDYVREHFQAFTLLMGRTKARDSTELSRRQRTDYPEKSTRKYLIVRRVVVEFRRLKSSRDRVRSSGESVRGFQPLSKLETKSFPPPPSPFSLFNRVLDPRWHSYFFRSPLALSRLLNVHFRARP